LEQRVLPTTMVSFSLMFFSLLATPKYHRYVIEVVCVLFFHLLLNSFPSHNFGFVCASLSTTILAVFDSTQTCIVVVKYASAFLGPGRVTRMRCGSLESRLCYKFWYLYRHWYWIRSPSLMSLDMNDWVVRQMVKSDLRSTVRVPFAFRWKQWLTRWGGRLR